MSRRDLLAGLLLLIPPRLIFEKRVKRVVAENGFAYPINQKPSFWICSDWTGDRPWPFTLHSGTMPARCQAYLLYGTRNGILGIMQQMPVGYRIVKSEIVWQVTQANGSTSWQCQGQNQ